MQIYLLLFVINMLIILKIIFMYVILFQINVFTFLYIMLFI